MRSADTELWHREEDVRFIALLLNKQTGVEIEKDFIEVDRKTRSCLRPPTSATVRRHSSRGFLLVTSLSACAGNATHGVTLVAASYTVGVGCSVEGGPRALYQRPPTDERYA